MSRNQARFIPEKEVTTVAEWNFGAVDQNSIRFAAKLKAQAEAQALSNEEHVRQLAHSEGYSEGYAEGYAQGHAKATLEGQSQLTHYIDSQGRELKASFAALFERANAQLTEAEQGMAQGVLDLACALARQVLRHELSTNPNALQPVVREALAMLSTDSKAAVVRLHPLDLDVLADVFQQEFAGLALTLVPDVSLARGGCLVESAGTVVDGTVEKRWKRAIASVGLDSPWEPADDDA